MNKGSLGVHEVKLVVESGPSFSDGRRVADHADGAWHLGDVGVRHCRWRLVVYSHLSMAKGLP